MPATAISKPAPDPNTIVVDFGREPTVAPEALPIDRLVDVEHVSIELSGPEDGMPDFTAAIQYTLWRYAIRIDSITIAPAPAPTFRAKLIISSPTADHSGS